jgi:tetratricopeptide (TPR) repeat protein
MFWFDSHSHRWIGPTGYRFAIRLALCWAVQVSYCSIGAAQLTPTEQHALGVSGIVDQARKLIQDGNPQGALALLQQADLRASNSSDIHTLKGVIFAMVARPIESSAEFNQAIALRPNFAPIYFSAGLAAANFDNLSRASELLSRALRLDPALPGLRYNYALVLARAMQYTESEEQADIELASKSPEPETPIELWKLKARDAYYQKKWQDTIDSYNKVLELQPDWAESYAAIGEAFFFLNRSQQSESAIRKALALDPEDGASHEILAKLSQDDGKEDEAIAEFEAAIRLRPTDKEAIYRLFRIYNKKGDTANAERLQNQLKETVASNLAESMNQAKGTSLNNTGMELEKRGDFAGALGAYDQASKVDMDDIVFQRNAALLLCKMGRTQEAIRRLRDILALDPDDPETLQILAVANELTSGNIQEKKSLPTPQSSH